MPEMTDTTYIEAVWFLPGQEMDVMGQVYRDGPDQPWQARYRFRYYNPDSQSPFDGKDRKSSYHATAPDGTAASLRDLCAAFDKVFAAMAEAFGARVKKVNIQGGADAFIREMGKQPWAHVKVTPKTPERPQ